MDARVDDRFDDRSRWILLALSEGDGPLDQIRVMKALFLLSQAPGHQLADLYDFEPFLYGPFDSQVYRDLDVLRARGSISMDASVGRRTRYVSLTAEGEEAARQYRRMLTEDDVRLVAQVRARVDEPSFRKLLDDISREYPAFAEHTIMSTPA